MTADSASGAGSTESGPPTECGDEVGPWRLERTEPGTDDPARWLPLGTRGSGVLALVDPAGLVGPPGEGWSLDWWVGADDRWYVPAREPAVRQSLVDASPVVETRQRVPGGDVVHRAYAAQGAEGIERREATVIEVTNETSVPVAIALAVRPYGVGAEGSVRRIVPHDDRTISVDGNWTVVADRPARNCAVGGAGTDPLGIVTDGRASAGLEPVEDPQRGASLALVFPLPHTATMRIVLVEGAPPRDPGAAFDGLPASDAVASGWARQADHGMRIELPDEKLEAAFAATRRRLLMGAPDLPTSSSRAEQALVGRALAQLGHGDELRSLIGSVLESQSLTGPMPDELGHESATGATLALLGWWWRHDPRPELLDELVGPLAKAARSIERRRSGRRNQKDSTTAGLLPAGPQPVELGGAGMAYLDDWWSAAGLVEAAAVLAAAGQDSAAEDVVAQARSLSEAIAQSAAASPSDDAGIPLGPIATVREGAVGLLPALAPLGIVDAIEPDVQATLALIRDELVGEGGSVLSGLAGDGAHGCDTASPWLTACLALHEAAEGDRRALGRLAWLLRVGASTAIWPRRIDERGVGLGGQGDDPVAGALFAMLVRTLLFSERRSPGAVHAEGLDVLPIVPPGWMGQGIEVHDAPTTLGSFGFAVRWHGERPALLWELARESGAPTMTLRCPGLAPGWSTTDSVGETLLPAPVADSDGAVMMDEDVSFS